MMSESPYPRSLQSELRELLADLNNQIDRVKLDAIETTGIDDPDLAYRFKDANGVPILSPLLIAKAQVLSALAHLP